MAERAPIASCPSQNGCIRGKHFCILGEGGGRARFLPFGWTVSPRACVCHAQCHRSRRAFPEVFSPDTSQGAFQAHRSPPHTASFVQGSASDAEESKQSSLVHNGMLTVSVWPYTGLSACPSWSQSL